MTKKCLVFIMVVSVLITTQTAFAQEEVICDPENPSCKTEPAPSQPEKPTSQPKTDLKAKVDDSSAQPVEEKTPLTGEEVICDPENPSCQPVPQKKPPSTEPKDEEVICDPENPSCVPKQKKTPSSTPSAPVFKEEPFDAAPTDVSAQFKGSYATSMLVDTSFDRNQEDIVEWMSTLTLDMSYDLSTSFRVVAQAQFHHWAGGKENLRHPDFLLNSWDKRAAYQVCLLYTSPSPRD